MMRLVQSGIPMVRDPAYIVPRWAWRTPSGPTTPGVELCLLPQLLSLQGWSVDINKFPQTGIDFISKSIGKK
jgi:hypothetical protein